MCASPVREPEEGRRPQGRCCGSIDSGGCEPLEGKKAKGELGAGGWVRRFPAMQGKAGWPGGNSPRRHCPMRPQTGACSSVPAVPQVSAGQIKEVLLRAEHSLHSPSKGQPW